MRLRFTLVALLAAALLLSAAAIVLGVVLRTALVEEIDRSLGNRVFEVVEELDATFAADEAFEAFSFPLDPDLEVVVVNFEDPAFAYVSLSTIEREIEDPDALLAVVSGADGWPPSDPITRDAGALGWPMFGNADFRLVTGNLFETDEMVIVARRLDGVDRTIERVREVALVTVPLISLLLAGLVWLLTGRALRPVEEIRREVEDISATDLARRVPETGRNDEIGRLASTMNRMLTRLDDAAVRQRRFVSDAAHELRSPLASMAAQLDVDLAHPTQADWPQTAVQVRAEATRMELLIESLLTLARQDNNATPQAATLVDLDDVIFAEVSALGRGDLTIDCSEVSAATVRGDEAQLRRIVNNLLTNAIRHANTRVAVEALVDGQDVVISIDDDGAGIATENHDVIFDRFVRLDEARARDAGGSGLGLAISREIALANDGTLVVGESALGGARFTLTLPAARA